MSLPIAYAETAAEPAPSAPPLEGETRADVCVVGAGYTGLSAALHLAESGTSVVVLEAEEPGYGASGRNGGQVNPGLKHDPDEVERHWGRDLGGRMLALSYGAPDYLFALVRRYQIACEARQNGTLRAAVARRHAAAVQRSAEQCARRDGRVRYLAAQELAGLTGHEHYAGAMFDPRGGDVNPLAYARGLARAALTQGARIHGKSRVLRLARDGRRWRVSTPTGTVIAESVVLATNGYTDGLWPRLRESIVPVFSSIAATAPLPGEVARHILPARCALYEAGHVTVYCRVDAANRFLIGGRGPQKPLSTLRPLRYLVRHAERLWPDLHGQLWTEAWNGRLAMTVDRYPHLHEPAPGIIAALGYNGRGVAMATVAGAQIAKRLCGAPLDALDLPVTPIKPIPLHRYWRIAVLAKVWEGRIRDRLGL